MPTFDNILLRWDGSVVIQDTILSTDPQGIEKFISKVCVQPAVYWENPRNNGTGGFTFDTPRMIYVRWEDKIQSINVARGKEVTSIAEVLVTEDLDLHGMLLLNTPFEQVGVLSPFDIAGAVEIVKIEKVPMIKSNSVFVRKVYVK